MLIFCAALDSIRLADSVESLLREIQRHAGSVHLFNSISLVQGGAKNGASLSHCKYYENIMTELRGN